MTPTAPTPELQLPTPALATLLAVLAEVSEVERAWVFGSRAVGRARPGSDIDLAVAGIAPLSPAYLRLMHLLDESDLVYHVDLVAYPPAAEALRRTIDTDGIEVYRRA
ncbi:MAG: nucleotidyltransferase domain-containing protein [Bacteroidia bacterium]|nr:nucleotidyltransferase domain-containing protein [Bacteroidia bacterium]